MQKIEQMILVDFHDKYSEQVLTVLWVLLRIHLPASVDNVYYSRLKSPLQGILGLLTDGFGVWKKLAICSIAIINLVEGIQTSVA